MLAKTLVPQDAVPTVAFIAHGISRGVLRGVIKRDIISLEQKLKGGAVGAQWPVGIVGIMTIDAGYPAGN